MLAVIELPIVAEYPLLGIEFFIYLCPRQRSKDHHLDRINFLFYGEFNRFPYGFFSVVVSPRTNIPWILILCL